MERVRIEARAVQALTGRVREAEESERGRLARELHDDFGQRLTALRMKLQLAQMKPQTPASTLDECVTISEDLLRDMRSFARGLRPPLLDEVGLAPALRALFELHSGGPALALDLDIPTDAPRLPQSTELAIFRVFQEALANVLRHADATRLSLELKSDDRSVNGQADRQWSGLRSARRGAGVGERPSSRPREHAGTGRVHRRRARGRVRAGTRDHDPVARAADHRDGRPGPSAGGGRVMSCTVLLADDHTLVRAGLRALLETLPDVSSVLEASDGREALEVIAAHRPDVVLMDIAMPRLNGLEAAAMVARDYPATRTIVLSMHGAEAHVLQALRAGAAGYLLKDAAAVELPLAIRAVQRGEIYISSAVSRVVVSGYLAGVTSEAAAGPLDSLSARQREILQLIAEGRTTKEIAFSLELSVKTVETHRRQLMERLQIFDVPGLVRFALRHGLISD